LKKISIIGHRGARSYAPENTLRAYAIALESGVDEIDVDVVVTADKILLAYHDLYINPEILSSSATCEFLYNNREAVVNDVLSGRDDLLIKNLTFSELKEHYNVGLNQNSDYAKWFPGQQQFPNNRLNSLQEIVDFINISTNNQIPIQIEIKNSFEYPNWTYSPDELASFVYDFITRNNLVNRIKVQAFDWRILARLNQYDANIKTAYLFAPNTLTEWQKWFADSIVMDVAKNMKMKELGFLPNLVKALGGYSYEPEDNELRYEDIKSIKKLGLKIFVWNWPERSGYVHNHELIMKLIGWQIDGFTTDNPRELRELLYKMGYPVSKIYKTNL
jgi:glycerophosphoryl diester phosphodiesterase